MDDFSPWDIADIFRLHEAACLIAGVMPLSKRVPDREELPAQAIPAYVKLGSAYVLNWVSYHKDLPDDPKCPTLKGCDAIPTLPKFEPLKKLTGEFVTRDELHRWVKAMGIKSAYSFAPIVASHSAEPNTAPAQTSATPAPVVAETRVQRQDRRLQACIDAGLPMNTKAALIRLPDGVGKVADSEGVTRQAFTDDVKAALKCRESAKREGVTVHRA